MANPLLRPGHTGRPGKTGGGLPLATGENLVTHTYPNVDFTPMYPGRSIEEIDQIQRECFSLRYVYAPFVAFQPLPVSLNYVEVTPGGYRSSGQSQPWPPGKESFVVFCFGGSTTFGYGLANEETVPVYLQEALRRLWPDKPVQVYNFGRGYYFSTQERILLEDLVMRGHVPRLAIFLDGLNDFYYWHGIPQFTSEFMWCSAPDRPATEPSPVVTDADLATAADSVIRRYRHNVRIAEGLADRYEFQVLFVGQPVPFFQYDRPTNTYPFAQSFPGHEVCARAYPFLHRAFTDHTFGSRAIWCGDAFLKSEKRVYVDSIHYSVEGGRILAGAIVTRAKERALLR